MVEVPRAQTEHFPAIDWMVVWVARMRPLEFIQRLWEWPAVKLLCVVSVAEQAAAVRLNPLLVLAQK
jgi:hypothetical protein